MQKGIFVVIDGNDGSGKATQTRMLVERLLKDGRQVEKIDFPRYGTPLFGELLGECLAGKHGDFVHLDPKIASTLYALDRYEASPQIREWLDAGKVVIADRFTSSNQIHQAGKILDTEKRDAMVAWIDRLEHDVLNTPRPDAVVYLRVPIDISLTLLSQEREQKNKEIKQGATDTVEKDRMYLERSIESAERLAGTSASWRAIDCVMGGALRSREDIHEEVYREVSALL